MDEAEFHKRLTSHLKAPTDEDAKKVEEFKEISSYVSGQYDTDDGFIELRKHIEELEKGPVSEGLKRDRLFYLALPPSVFGQVAAHLKHNVYPGKEGTARIIIEKPFGSDLSSYRALQAEISPEWSEEDVYRIDHYLGKEMVKNMLYFRFTNQFLHGVWNKENIAAVKISFKEPFGTEGRGGYFDEIGIIRDVMQNHLLQVLTLVAMERPVTFSPEDIRDEKVKVLKSMRQLNPHEVVLGQYGKSADGSKPAYVDDDTVPEGSRAVTFAAFECKIDNDRWQGVPFILSAGKALDEGRVDIRIQFKEVVPFRGHEAPQRNELRIRVQPKEAITMSVNSKLPGLHNGVSVTDLDLSYAARFKDAYIPEAYEALILDALREDHSNFVRDDELDESWSIFTPLLHYIEDKNNKINLENYPYGSTGPSSYSKFLEDRGFIELTPGPYQSNL